MAKAVAYSGDRHRFGLAYGWAEVAGRARLPGRGRPRRRRGRRARGRGALGLGTIATGLAFFAILGTLSALFELPFDLYATFRIEEKHGFNRQTLGGFFLDRLKGSGIAIALGGPVLAAVLWLMERMGPSWWLWAWGVTTAFSLFAAWIYPTVLAPLFNRFTPLPDGELKEAILDLARRTGFRAGGISVMDASRRTAHGNAYFTGVFGQKRIVLFDTLLEAMGSREVVAVLAHELGHFKLHHVRWGMARGIATSGLVFYALSLCLPLDAVLLGLLPRDDRLRRARGLRPLVRPGELPAAAARERPLAPARVRGRRLRPAERRDRGRAGHRAPQAQREEPTPARHPPALLAGLPLPPAAPRAAAGDGGARERLRRPFSREGRPPLP